MTERESDNVPDEMSRREITLKDGRYMVFYTFGDDDELKREDNDQREDV